MRHAAGTSIAAAHAVTTMTLLGCVGFLATAVPCRAQSLHWQRDYALHFEEGPRPGRALLSDVDGDGVRDVASGWKRIEAGVETPQIALLSGGTLDVLSRWTIGATPPDPDDGFLLVNGGDVDGDGLDDLLVGTPLDVDGRVDVLSARDGAVLLTLRGTSPLERFGSSLAGIGDVDGDGRGDFAIGAPGPVFTGDQHGRIALHSGAGGAVLHEWTGVHVVSQLGYAGRMASVQDRDGDGRRDVAAGDSQHAAGLRFFSTGDGGELPSMPFTEGEETVAEVGDVDGDGVADLAWAGGFDTVVEVRSGADGRLLHEAGYGVLGQLPSIGDAGDLDHDGYDDYFVAGCFDPWNDRLYFDVVEVWSARSSTPLLTLQSVSSSPSPEPAHALLCDDCDGDGVAELLVDGFVGYFLAEGGFVRLDLASGTELDRVDWLRNLDSWSGGTTLYDDVDGDGSADLLMNRYSTGAGDEPHPIVVLSSRDGSIVRAWDGAYGPSNAFSPGGPILTLPDLDGDGVSEFMVGNGLDPDVKPLVEVRSGGDGATLFSVQEAFDWNSSHFGGAIAFGIDEATGAAHLAIGASHVPKGTMVGVGKLDVYGLDGRRELRVPGVARRDHFGASVAWLGDVDGDGSGDWAVGAPDADAPLVDAGRVSIVSGRTGAIVRDLSGSFASGQFGACLVAVPDVDGDGVDDLLVGAPGAGSSKEGQAMLFSAATGALIATWSGAVANDDYGARVGLFPDVNHDGVAELLLASPATDRLDFVSTTTGRLLQTVRPPSNGVFPDSLPLIDTRLAQRFADERHATLATTRDAFAIPTSYFDDLLALDVGDLFLTLTPNSAAPGEVVTGLVRGGPPGSPAGIYVSRIDDFPLDQFLLFGFLDSFGEWSVVDTAPPGLSGMSYFLRGYTVGFDRRLAISSEEELHFE